MYVCVSLSSAFYKDPDDKFDVGSYVVPRVFSGSLSVVNQNFSRNTTALHDLATQVQHKVWAAWAQSHFCQASLKTTNQDCQWQNHVLVSDSSWTDILVNQCQVLWL